MIDNINQMLCDRGYEVTINEEFLLGERKSDTICVFKVVIEKLNNESFQHCIHTLNQMNIKHGIIIYNNITAPVKKLIHNTNELDLTIEIFLSSEMSYNPTKHRLTPKHIQVDPETSKLLRANFNVEKFPWLKTTDIISRYYAFKKGDIIKIIRKTGMVVYRIVK